MNGKIIVGFIVAASVLAGAAVYYFQVYGYYDRVPAAGPADVQVISLESGEPVPVTHSGFEAIDATSSPIRYRACFTTDADLELLRTSSQILADATPRNAPGWFSCFDATLIAAALEDGTATAFLAQKNVEYGVDRIVAITKDGRGFIWHDLNKCGEKAYDGTVVGEACPPRPDAS
ncbi:MAG: DUF6446 family protein [Pseudomonadota bacterium]